MFDKFSIFVLIQMARDLGCIHNIERYQKAYYKNNALTYNVNQNGKIQNLDSYKKALILAIKYKLQEKEVQDA